MISRILLYASLLTLSFGCSGDRGDQVLRVAVTTSTRDSGLLEHILPAFEQAQAARVDVIAVGTGKALKLGESGDVDALLCHAERAELEFMKVGHGTRREVIMQNWFFILGPQSDPAAIEGLSAADALNLIRTTNQTFVSRGDESGTHQCELRIWTAAGGLSNWPGYHESGQGMGQTLIMADQMQGYVLCDQGTYLNFRSKISLKPLVTSSDETRNPYAVLVVNPDKHDSINSKLAEAFADYLISNSTQTAIGDYRVEGEQLFYPLRTNIAN